MINSSKSTELFIKYENDNNIEQELKELVAAEVLQIEQIAGMMLYELAADVRVRQTIKRFMEACHDRTFRTRAIYHVIQRMHHARRHQ